MIPESICLVKIESGLYRVFFAREFRGFLIKTRSGWCFVLNFRQQVYWGCNREEALKPFFDYKAWRAYRGLENA